MCKLLIVLLLFVVALSATTQTTEARKLLQVRRATPIINADNLAAWLPRQTFKMGDFWWAYDVPLPQPTDPLRRSRGESPFYDRAEASFTDYTDPISVRDRVVDSAIPDGIQAFLPVDALLELLS